MRGPRVASQEWSARRYAETAHFVPALGAPVLDLLAPSVGERILDLGCGDGVLTEKISAAGATVVAVDAAPEMVAYAASRSRSAANVTYEVGSAGALSFLDSTFDTVVSSLTMHHLAAADQLPAVREMRRVLKPGGRLLIAEFQAPRGHGWRLLLGPTGLSSMAHAVPHIEAQVAEVGFSEIELGEVAPVLKYVRAVNCPS